MKTFFITILALLFLSSLCIAQDTLYIYKSGAVVVERAVGDIDSIIFYKADSELAIVLPTLSTSGISSITSTDAAGGGNLISDGGATITSKGVCWSTLSNPTTSDSKTIDGDGTGGFSSTIIGLTAGTTYYVRAYATNSAGTGYGNMISFKSTDFNPYQGTYHSTGTFIHPTSGTRIIDEIKELTTVDSKTVHTTVGDLGGYDAYFEVDPVTNSVTVTGTLSASQALVQSGVNTYDPATKTFTINYYYVGGGGNRVISEVLVKLDKNDIPVTDIDGNVYNTVKIGYQTWMKENLKTTRYADGSSLIDYTSYNNNNSNVPTYGRLYTWAAVMNNSKSSDSDPSGVQGICPSGWHLPSLAEWTILSNCLGGQNTAGGKLKESGNAHWVGNNTGGDNSSGFSALPAGERSNAGYSNLGNATNFWSSTESPSNSGHAWYLLLMGDNAEGNIAGNSKTNSYSVRCLQDTKLPTLTTREIYLKTSIEAEGGGNLTSDGGARITARGVCWSTSSNPTTSDNKTIDGTGTGEFASSIIGLNPGTTYYVRAYATNRAGTGYGNEISFKTAALSISLGCETDVLNAIGIDLAPDDVIDLRFLIVNKTTGDLVYVVDDGWASEVYYGLDTLDNGEYLLGVDLSSTLNFGDLNAPISISLSLNFLQKGMIKSTLEFPNVMNNERPCSSYRTYLAEIKKVGAVFTITKAVSYLIDPSAAEPGVMAGTWSGKDVGYTSEIVSTVDGGKLLFNGIGRGWMQDWWGEAIITQTPVEVVFNPADGTLGIAQQPIMTTTYDGGTGGGPEPQPEYFIKGTIAVNYCGGPDLVISYDFIQPDGAGGIAQYMKLKNFTAIVSLDTSGKKALSQLMEKRITPYKH